MRPRARIPVLGGGDAVDAFWQFSHALSQTFLWSVVAFVAVCFSKLVRVSLDGGLLSSDSAGDSQPERVVALVSTIAVATGLAVESLSAINPAAIHFPEPNDLLVWAAGGGQLSYILGKSMRRSRRGGF
jgi:hypothetical protein